MIDLADIICRCGTCGSPAAAVTADLAANDLFRCATCGTIRALPSAAREDGDYDEGRWVGAGGHICGPCARESRPEYARHISDGDDVRCDCGDCGGWRGECACVVWDIDGERGCATHRCRV